jgi:hypothetical protein
MCIHHYQDWGVPSRESPAAVKEWVLRRRSKHRELVGSPVSGRSALRQPRFASLARRSTSRVSFPWDGSDGQRKMEVVLSQATFVNRASVMSARASGSRLAAGPGLPQKRSAPATRRTPNRVRSQCPDQLAVVSQRRNAHLQELVDDHVRAQDEDPQHSEDVPAPGACGHAE